MDWNAERTRQALKHIATLLLFFAALAERAAGLSHPGRRPVLWILRRAEIVAREFVTGQASGEIPVAESEQGDAEPCEATRLALSFRALASSLNVLVAQTLHFVRHGSEREIHEVSRGLSGIAQRVLAPDTS